MVWLLMYVFIATLDFIGKYSKVLAMFLPFCNNQYKINCFLGTMKKIGKIRN